MLGLISVLCTRRSVPPRYTVQNGSDLPLGSFGASLLPLITVDKNTIKVGGCRPVNIIKVGGCRPVNIIKVGGCRPVNIIKVDGCRPVNIIKVGGCRPVNSRPIAILAHYELRMMVYHNPLIPVTISFNIFNEISRDEFNRLRCSILSRAF